MLHVPGFVISALPYPIPAVQASPLAPCRSFLAYSPPIQILLSVPKWKSTAPPNTSVVLFTPPPYTALEPWRSK